MMRVTLVLSALFTAAWLTACGSDNSGSPKGSSTGTGGHSSVNTPATCTGGAFAALDAPYSANNTIAELAVADAAGLVLSPNRDASRLSDPSTLTDYPSIVITIDTQGTIKQLWSGDNMPLQIAADTSNVYVHTMGLSGGDLMSVPRAGGSATVLADGTVHAGPLLIGGKLYFVGTVGSVSQGVYELDPAGGTPKLLNDRGDMMVSAFNGNADSLYWTEYSSFSDTQFPLYRMKLADNSVESLGSLSPDIGIDELFIVGSDLYMAGIVDISYPLNRFVSGQSPVMVIETTGAIAFSTSAAYYSSRSGLVKTPLDFSVTSAMPETSTLDISAIAIGPDKLWYAERGCIYRDSL